MAEMTVAPGRPGRSGGGGGATATGEGAWRSAARRRAGTPRGSAAPIRSWVRFLGSAGVLVALVAAALLVPWLVGIDDRTVNYETVRQAPSLAHPFGTDEAGRDLLIRSLAGLRVSLLVAVVSAAVATVLGTVLGAVSALGGGWTDRLLMRLVDGVNAVPHLLLGIVIVALYRGSVLAVIASIALTHWTVVARIVRAEVLSLRDRPFIDAAVSGGAGRRRVLRRHILPAVVPQAALCAVLLLPHAVWHETALSFLGLGLPPHMASIGNILGAGRSALLMGSWWMVVLPSALLVAVSLAVAGLGGTWRDRMVPRRRSELAL